ncbi:DMT family transporter [Flavobacteriaceae bacterium]|nr:DMT family transporter [Flavobacteriaceae bacterium]
MQNDRSRSLILYHFVVVIFGFSSVLGALISLDAIPLVIYRMGLAALGLAFFFAVYKPNYFHLSRDMWGKVVLGGIIIAVHWVTFFHAIKVAGVSLTLSMMSTGAFITAMLEPLLTQRKILIYEILFGGITAVGVGLIFNAEFEQFYGILVALLSAFLSALFTILNNQMVKKALPITLSFYELLVGTVVGVFYVLIFGNYTWNNFQFSGYDWIWMLALAWICTSYAFNISIKVMKHLSSFTIMMIINLEPIYGILLSLAIWNEREYMSPSFYLGFFIVLGSILINGIYKHKKEGLKKRI